MKITKVMTEEEAKALSDDLRYAKLKVFREHGFSYSEIAEAMHVPESTIREWFDTYENK